MFVNKKYVGKMMSKINLFIQLRITLKINNVTDTTNKIIWKCRKGTLIRPTCNKCANLEGLGIVKKLL